MLLKHPELVPWFPMMTSLFRNAFHDVFFVVGTEQTVELSVTLPAKWRCCEIVLSAYNLF